jgi:hypothetical protein
VGYAASETTFHTFDVTFEEQNVTATVCSCEQRAWRSVEGQSAVCVAHHGIQNCLQLTVCSQLDHLLGNGNYASTNARKSKIFHFAYTVQLLVKVKIKVKVKLKVKVKVKLTP